MIPTREVNDVYEQRFFVERTKNPFQLFLHSFHSVLLLLCHHHWAISSMALLVVVLLLPVTVSAAGQSGDDGRFGSATIGVIGAMRTRASSTNSD